MLKQEIKTAIANLLTAIVIVGGATTVCLIVWGLRG